MTRERGAAVADDDESGDEEGAGDAGRGIALLAAGLALGAVGVAFALAHRRETPSRRTTERVNQYYERFGGLGSTPMSHPMLHSYLWRVAGVHRFLNKLGFGDERAAKISGAITPGRADAAKHFRRWDAEQAASDPMKWGRPQEWRFDNGRWRWVDVPAGKVRSQ